jgi:hypothetical protein
MSTVTAISFKPKATRKRLKKEILSDDFKKRKIFWKIFYGKFSTSHHYVGPRHRVPPQQHTPCSKKLLAYLHLMLTLGIRAVNLHFPVRFHGIVFKFLNGS